MRDLARLTGCVHRVAKAVAANAGMRMDLAILAHLACGAEKYMWMQNAARTDFGRILHHRVSANQAAIANARSGANDTIGTEIHSLADNCIAMHDRRRMTLSPLRKSARLAVEVLQKNGHSHGDILDRETTAVCIRVRAQMISHIRVHDENGGLMRSRLIKLRSIS